MLIYLVTYNKLFMRKEKRHAISFILFSLVLMLIPSIVLQAEDVGSDWMYTPGAYYNEEQGYFVLTEDYTEHTKGAMWYNRLYKDDFILELDYYTGSKNRPLNGADGIAIAFYANYDYSMVSGGALGFVGSGGYGIELDTYYNSGDPNGNHIALIKGNTSNHLAVASLSEAEDEKWHHLKVVVENGICSTYVDDVLKMTHEVEASQYGGIGITASTGAGTNLHAVKNISIVCEWDNANLSDVDKEIIEKVKLYTSNSGETYIKQIEFLNEKLKDATPEQKLKVLTELYTKNGFNDVREAVAYYQDALQARRAYDFLTNDEIFCAYQYFNYLNTTTKGQIARGLLMADNCIFNNSLKQYIDPSTYITGETQSIKNYKSLLLDFMGYNSLDIELPAQLKNMQKAAMAAADLTDETVKSSYVKRIKNSKTTEEVKQIVTEMLEACKSDDGKWTMHVKGYSGISKLLDYSGTTFDILAETVEDIEYVALLETRVQLLDYYSDFLQSIVDGKDVLPYGMVVAAEQLQEELLNPYGEVIEQIAGQLSDHVTNDAFEVDKFLTDKLDDAIKAKLPKSWQTTGISFGDAIATIELGAWAVDWAAGIGATVEQSACVEAYAYLGMYYQTLLRQCKAEFLENQSVENAWKFYDTYQLLFSIRVKGENAYLKMFDTHGIVKILVDVGGWDYFGISDKKAFVQDTFDYMNNKCIFELENANEIGTEHYYAQKAVIECPVNVEVYDGNGNLIYTIYDGQPCDESNEHGRFVCDYVPSIGEYVKAVYLNDDAEYSIKAVGVDAGNVSIKIGQNIDEKVQIAQKTGLSILKGGVITTKIDTGEYAVDSNGDGNNEIVGELADITSEEVILVEKISLSESELILKVGEKTSLGVVIEPENALFTDVRWTSDAQNVVTVVNGSIRAVGVGTATIQAKCGDAVASCIIQVEDIKLVDVPVGSWKYEPAKYVYQRGIMTGKGFDANGNVMFDPDAALTREQFAQILYSAEGKESIVYSGTFVDVKNNQWYTSAVLWAADNGIVSGYGEGRFGVGDSITREQLAAMLYKYAINKGYDTSARAEFDRFNDVHKISPWATEQLSWAVANGIMSGKGEGLDPTGSATRAECAAMLKAFLLKFEAE